jgi:hypothetical protein
VEIRWLGIPEVLAGIFAATAIGCLLYGLRRWRGN